MAQTAPLCARRQPIPQGGDFVQQALSRGDFGVDLNLGKETQHLPEEIAPAGLLT